MKIFSMRIDVFGNDGYHCSGLGAADYHYLKYYLFVKISEDPWEALQVVNPHLTEILNNYIRQTVRL